MTEEEAKLKTCCGPDHAGELRWVADAERNIRFCSATACMAWRWGIMHPLGGFIEFAPNPAIAADIAKRNPEQARTIGGYCGLAGKP